MKPISQLRAEQEKSILIMSIEMLFNPTADPGHPSLDNTHYRYFPKKEGTLFENIHLNVPAHPDASLQRKVGAHSVRGGARVVKWTVFGLSGGSRSMLTPRGLQHQRLQASTCCRTDSCRELRTSSPVTQEPPAQSLYFKRAAANAAEPTGARNKTKT